MTKEKKLAAFGRLLDIMEELREKCPWDREQTFESLRNNTIEEAYELADAIVEGNPEEIRKELGDLLLHIVFYAKIGSEKGAFDIADVANGISDKLIYRHPHVFSEAQAETPEQVSKNWEQLKMSEKKERQGVLSGVPQSLPSMVKAWRIGQKAASAGFDWEEREDVWEKVREELFEVETEMRSLCFDAARQSGEAMPHTQLQEEFGDLLFALINAARLYKIDPELALERCNRKFIRRFNHIEARVAAQGKQLRDLPLEALEAYWQEAKERDEPLQNFLP